MASTHDTGSVSERSPDNRNTAVSVRKATLEAPFDIKAERGPSKRLSSSQRLSLEDIVKGSEADAALDAAATAAAALAAAERAGGGAPTGGEKDPYDPYENESRKGSHVSDPYETETDRESKASQGKSAEGEPQGEGGGESDGEAGEDDDDEEALVRRIAWIEYYVSTGDLNQARLALYPALAAQSRPSAFRSCLLPFSNLRTSSSVPRVPICSLTN